MKPVKLRLWFFQCTSCFLAEEDLFSTYAIIVQTLWAYQKADDGGIEKAKKALVEVVRRKLEEPDLLGQHSFTAYSNGVGDDNDDDNDLSGSLTTVRAIQDIPTCKCFIWLDGYYTNSKA